VRLALLLVQIPAILMAPAIVREKELGSVTNLYVTPVRRIEFPLGKQLSYTAISPLNFLILFLMAIFIFDLPLKGSFPALLLGAVPYLTATTRIGMLMSPFARTRIAALFATALFTILPATQFSGMLVPVSRCRARRESKSMSTRRRWCRLGSGCAQQIITTEIDNFVSRSLSRPRHRHEN
jgi:ribosome-dependent ATPase